MHFSTRTSHSAPDQTRRCASACTTAPTSHPVCGMEGLPGGPGPLYRTRWSPACPHACPCNASRTLPPRTRSAAQRTSVSLSGAFRPPCCPTALLPRRRASTSPFRSLARGRHLVSTTVTAKPAVSGQLSPAHCGHPPTVLTPLRPWGRVETWSHEPVGNPPRPPGRDALSSEREVK